MHPNSRNILLEFIPVLGTAARNVFPVKEYSATLLDLFLVESQTRTYHGRVGSERQAERPGGVGQDWAQTELFAQETKVHRSLQGIEETSLQRLSRSTNK